MTAGVSVSFFGVRGSTPCSCPELSRFGGNTSCVVVQRDGEDPIVCDVGTGLRFYGLSLDSTSFEGTFLVSHLHWDHVQGLPFFPQLLDADSRMKIYGPPEDDCSFSEALGRLVCPPYFPVTLDVLSPNASVDDLDNESVAVGSARIMARPVPHTGRTNGYRIEWDEFSMAYVPDHQEPVDDTESVADSVLELADGVDLLIHDAQFTPDLLSQRSNWGHCTVRYASRVAEQAGARQLAMFHHDPLHDDETIEKLEAEASSWELGHQVFAAAEGMKLSY